MSIAGEVAMSRFPLESLLQEPETAARSLLGCLLHRETGAGLVAGIIVETEAYLGINDPASHSARGKSDRNASMFGPAGRAYVYLIYGVHHCFNVVTGPEGSGEAVLIRAVEPLHGLELMEKRRGKGCPPENLCSGPGKLCQAFSIDLALDGHNLADPPLMIKPRPENSGDFKIVTSPRIGIKKAAELPLRFYIDRNTYLSRRNRL